MEGAVSSSDRKGGSTSQREAVRQWMNKFEDAFMEKKLSRKKDRSVILLDETKGEEERKDGIRLSLSRPH